MILPERMTALTALITQTSYLKPESLDEKEGNLVYSSEQKEPTTTIFQI